MNIQDARNIFTKKLIAVYKEKLAATSFLRSFFPSVESLTKEISIEVQRNGEPVAVDVHRYSDGNLNKFSKSTEKIFIPPFFYEYIVANDHRLYDVAIAAVGTDSGAAMLAALASEMADELFMLQQKIERKYELMCSQVLEDGIVQLRADTNIDFKRKAGSLVDLGGGNYWTSAVDPYEDLAAGANFLRTIGKSGSGIFNGIFGGEALSGLLNNTTFKERNDLKNLSLDAVNPPQRNSEGAAFHGEITIGSYKLRIWTYPQFYDLNGTSTPYLDEKKVIMLPENPNFKLAFAAIPQLIDGGGNIPQKGAYVVQEFIDQKKTAHEISIKSAGIPVPVAVDQIYTAKVIGG